MQLSIIIVNYSAGKFIADCINSALIFPSARNFEWIIVDNSNNKNDRNSLLELFPFIKWIDMGYNAGFARANNAGIKQSQGEIVLLLNPDTIVIDDCINKCLQKFYVDEAIASSVQLINTDGSLQITGNYFMKGGLNHLLPLPYLGKFLRNIAFAFKAKKPNVLVASGHQKVDWINGAFLMVKKTAIEKAGLMDEDFFLYAEESEWCSRLKKVGDLVVYGDLRIVHLQGEVINAAANSSDKGYFNLYDKKGLQLIVSNNLRIRKQYGNGWYIFNLLMYIIEIPVFFICLLLDNIFCFRNPFKDWKLPYKYSVNVFILIRLSPLIFSGRKHFYKML
ncbi:glycosyltransferase family 2 protein [Parafilimonas sp.]|uniref:glycosyltransferase family 2 protein n=1 Tax=Parafilimonas sp. TaxID=1969739 RepID=UPI0039E710DA